MGQKTRVTTFPFNADNFIAMGKNSVYALNFIDSLNVDDNFNVRNVYYARNVSAVKRRLLDATKT